MRRALGWGGVGLSLSLASAALAEAPPGPRLAFLRSIERPASLAIATSDASLRAPAAVAGGGIQLRPLPYPASGPAWSSDGSRIAFSGMRGPLPGILRPARRQIYVVASDGAAMRAIPGTRGGFAPVFSPDGKSIAFAKTATRAVHAPGPTDRPPWRSTTVWRVGLSGGGRPRRLTEWQNGVENLPSSFSPDGSVLAMTHRDSFRDRADAIALRLDGRGSYLLADSASWPKHSPDGFRIAFLGIGRADGTSCCERGDGFSVDLYTMNADRSSPLRLTDTPGEAERAVSWDPSGERLVYTTKSPPTERASGDLEAAVMQVNSDGSCPTRFQVRVPRLRDYHLLLRYPTWQPGPGRDAGRIEC